MDTGSREENVSKQQSRASLLIQSEAKMLYSEVESGSRKENASINNLESFTVSVKR
jgi:hypothetical protein